MNDQLDPAIVNLTKSIALTESGKDGVPNYNAVGDNGTSKGAYQWQPGNFEAAAKSAGLDPNDFSPANQNKVAYHQVLNPAQIAAAWNAGEAKAKDGSWQQNIGTTTINGKSLSYDTPAYVQKVNDEYKKLAGAGNIQTYNPKPFSNPTNGNPGLINETGTSLATPANPHPGFIQGLQEDLSGTNPESLGTQIGNTVKGVGNFLFPAVGDVYHDIKGDNTKTGLQQLGDLGSTALGAVTLIPGVGEGALAAKGLLTGAKLAEGGAELASKASPSVLSSVGKNAALGAGFGATQALGAGATDPKQIAEGTAIGAVGGGILGEAGGLIGKAAQTLPQRLVQGVIKTSPDVADYAVKKGLSSPEKMLADSESSITGLGTQLGKELEHSGVADMKVTLGDLLPDIQKAEPDAEITADSLKESLLKVAPLKKALITKLTEGEGLTLKELNKLKSEIGSNVYKTVFDDPTVKAGKQIGNAFYQAVKSKIIGAAPETEGLFDQLSKEYSLNGALDKAIKRGAKSQALTLKDIMALIGGFSALGPLGAAGAYGLEKAATNPSINLRAAGLLSKAVGASKIAPAATTVGSGLLGHMIGSQR